MRRDIGHAKRRERRRGFSLSFGDVILPFVGIAAIGLLVVAGKLFFMSGINGMSGSFRPSPDVARPELFSQYDGEQEGQESQAGQSRPNEGPFAQSALNNNLTENNRMPSALAASVAPVTRTLEAASPAEALSVAPAVVPAANNAGTNAGETDTDRRQKESGDDKRPALTVIATPVALAEPVPLPESEVRQAPTPAAPKAAAPQNTTPRTAPKNAPASNVKAPSWRVQVGAYATKQSANEIVGKLAKAGYTATVYTTGKFHKVWVQAGSTRQAAEAVAGRLKKLGYPGSYVVPPPSR